MNRDLWKTPLRHSRVGRSTPITLKAQAADLKASDRFAVDPDAEDQKQNDERSDGPGDDPEDGTARGAAAAPNGRRRRRLRGRRRDGRLSGHQTRPFSAMEVPSGVRAEPGGNRVREVHKRQVYLIQARFPAGIREIVTKFDVPPVDRRTAAHRTRARFRVQPIANTHDRGFRIVLCR